MNKSLTTFLTLGAFFLTSPGVFSAETSGDPNAAIRKLQPTNPNAALEEFEKVKRLTNDANIAHFTDVLAKKPKDADAYAKRGKAYSGNKLYDKAMEDYSRAIKLDPKNKDAYVGRAVVYLMQKDYDKCWKDVHKAEALGGEFWPSFKDSLKAGSGRDK